MQVALTLWRGAPAAGQDGAADAAADGRSLLPSCAPAALPQQRVLHHSALPFLCKHVPLLLPAQMEGPCLVVLTDGTVAQSYIPDNDFRWGWDCVGGWVRGWEGGWT